MRSPMIRHALASLAGATALLLSAATFAGSTEMKIVDLSTNPPPDEILKPFKLGAVKKDKKVYFTDFAIRFATKGQWVAGGTGYNKEVSAVLWGELVGLTDEKLQETVDEAYAYAQQRYGEMYTVIPDAEVDQAMTAFEKVVANGPALKPEQLRVETPSPYAKGFAFKVFVPGNKPRWSAAGVPMGVGMAMYKAQLKLDAMTIGYQNQVEFARPSGSVGRSGDGTSGKTATVAIEPFLSMVGGGPIYSNTKMAVGMLQGEQFAGFPDKSWVKEIRKNEKDVHEIVVDPELYKQAALKLIKAHIDSHVAAVKAELK